ncbi:unnamed protein product, partial [Brassica oleracea var. botrytis]
CTFLVFLCLTVLLIPEFAKSQGVGKPIIIGACTETKVPHCNETCIEGHFFGGKCVYLPPPCNDFVCICIPKWYK